MLLIAGITGSTSAFMIVAMLAVLSSVVFLLLFSFKQSKDIAQQHY
jgi:hypothetical protein